MTKKMHVKERIAEVRDLLSDARSKGKSIGLVPTMGALHEGHLTLVDEARRVSDFVVATIFINPTQFAPGEDLDKYPRDLEGDFEKLGARGVDLVFTPDRSEMYPDGFSTTVAVSDLTNSLCGISRPDHFKGVTTVVSKLFNIVGPCRAVFGRKDYQQLQTIKKMVADLDMQIEVVGAPTLREPDGLAMSSRNAYLSDDDRKRALSISSGLAFAHGLFKSGECEVGALRREVEESIQKAGCNAEYVTAAHPQTLEPLSDDVKAPGKLLIAVAVIIGSTRLIDNTVLGEDEPPIRPV